MPIDTDLEERIAGRGDRAIPALEKELRLGVPFKTLDRLFKAEGSRRWAVVRVLARIQGERSTDLLVRSLSDPPGNLAMRLDTLKALGSDGLRTFLLEAGTHAVPALLEMFTG